MSVSFLDMEKNIQYNVKTKNPKACCTTQCSQVGRQLDLGAPEDNSILLRSDTTFRFPFQALPS